MNDLYTVPGAGYMRAGLSGTHLLCVDPFVLQDGHTALMLVDALRDRGYRIDFQGPDFVVVSPLPQAPEPTL